MTKISKEAEEAKPKKPMTNFFRYRLDVMDSVKAKYPDLDGRAIMKVISKMWEDYPEKEKEKMSDQFQDDYDDYLREMEKWREKYNIPSPEKTRRSKSRSSKSRSSRSKSKRSRSRSRSKSKSRRR